MERITSYDITTLRNTASRNRASGVLGSDRAPVAPGAGPQREAATADERRARRQLAALERVRKARIALAEAEADIERTIALLEMLGDRPSGRGGDRPTLPPGIDPADADRLDDVHADLERARRRSTRRGGGQEVLSLEMAERLILERLGYADYEAFDADRRRRDEPVLDFAHLEFAQHELAEAEAAWRALLDGADPPDDEWESGPRPLPVWQGPTGVGPSFGQVAGFADDLGIADVPPVDGTAGRVDQVGDGDDAGVALLEELAADPVDAIEVGPVPVDGVDPVDPVDAIESPAVGVAGSDRPLPRRRPRFSPTSAPLPQRVRPDRRAAS